MLGASFSEELEGIQRFPMRQSSRCAHKGYEDKVQRNFQDNGYNLFGLSNDPQSYYSHPQFEIDFLKYQFWILGKKISSNQLQKLHSAQVISLLLDEQIIVVDSSGLFRSTYRAIPFQGKVFFASHYDRDDEHMVYLSNDSLNLAEYIHSHFTKLGTVLDLCSGSGFLGQVTQADIYHAFELNPKANALANLNSKWNGLSNLFYSHAESYDQSAEYISKADLIIFNPPFIYGPAARGFLDSDGGEYGLEHTIRILDLIQQHSKESSQFVCIGQSPVVNDEIKLLSKLRSLSDFEIQFEILDSFPPFEEHKDWYFERGVSEIVQYRIHAKRSEQHALTLVESAEKEYCFV